MLGAQWRPLVVEMSTYHLCLLTQKRENQKSFGNKTNGIEGSCYNNSLIRFWAIGGVHWWR